MTKVGVFGGKTHLKSYCLVSVEVDMSVAVCWAQNYHQHYNQHYQHKCKWICEV